MCGKVCTPGTDIEGCGDYPQEIGQGWWEQVGMAVQSKEVGCVSVRMGPWVCVLCQSGISIGNITHAEHVENYY